MAKGRDDFPDRSKKQFLTKITNVAMFAGLVTAYGTLAAIAARFLYPSRPAPKGWMYVSPLERFGRGESRRFQTPSGEAINITRQGTDGDVRDFVALSSVCRISDAKCTGNHRTIGIFARATTGCSHRTARRPPGLPPMRVSRSSSTRSKSTAIFSSLRSH